MIVEKKLEALGLALPDTQRDYAVNASGARFVSHLAVGNMLYVSGTCAMKDGRPFRQGVVGADLSLEQGYEAARYALLPTLGVIKYALGDLDRVQQAVQMLGFVNSSPTFSDQPRVINGATDLLVELYGDRGKPTRRGHRLPGPGAQSFGGGGADGPVRGKRGAAATASRRGRAPA